MRCTWVLLLLAFLAGSVLNGGARAQAQAHLQAQDQAQPPAQAHAEAEAQPHAQAPPQGPARIPVPGDIVRVTAKEAQLHKREAVLTAFARDTVGIQIEGRRLVLGLDHVDKLEVRAGMRRHALQGAVTGVLVGAAAATVAAMANTTHEPFGLGSGEMAAWLLQTFAIPAGAILGGLVGFAYRSARWDVVHPPPDPSKAPRSREGSRSQGSLRGY